MGTGSFDDESGFIVNSDISSARPVLDRLLATDRETSRREPRLPLRSGHAGHGPSSSGPPSLTSATPIQPVTSRIVYGHCLTCPPQEPGCMPTGRKRPDPTWTTC